MLTPSWKENVAIIRFDFVHYSWCELKELLANMVAVRLT